MPTEVKCLLWDFGDTLCNERFIWGASKAWMALYRSFDDGWAEDWNTGAMDTRRFAERAGQQLGISPDEVVAHMEERSRHVEFYPFTYAYFKVAHLPQAIVTVNPDLWTNLIVPLHALDAHVEVIVASWEEATTDKRVLCRRALERMGGNHLPHQALLIDNKESNVAAWRECGGLGYHYVSDERFEADVSRGVAGLPRPAQ